MLTAKGLYIALLLTAIAVMAGGVVTAVRLWRLAPRGELRRVAGLLLALVCLFLCGYVVTFLALSHGHEQEHILVATIYFGGGIFVLVVLRFIGELLRKMQAEIEALRDSEEKFRALADQSPNLIYTIDLASGRILYLNELWTRELGVDRNLLLAGMSGFEEHVDPTCRELLRSAHARQGRGEDVPAFECTFLDAARRPRETLVATRRIVLGGRNTAIGIVADITDHKRREAALRHRLEIESLLELISGSFVAAAPGELEEVIGHALGSIGGYAGADRCAVSIFPQDGGPPVVGFEWRAPGADPLGGDGSIPPGGLPWLFERIRRFETVQVTDARTMPAVAAAEREWMLRRGVRSLLAVPLVARRVLEGFMWFESAHPRRTWSEEDMGLFVVAGDLLAGAIERRRATDGLRESEERFRMLFDSATDGIFILGLDGAILDLNRTAHERLGYAKEELLALPITHIDLPEDASLVPERIGATLRDGIAVFESTHRRRDGSAMPVEVNARVIEYRGQKAFLSVARDISERKAAEADLRRAKEDLERQNEELRALDRMKDGLIRDVSHELKTPVAKHSMQLEILKRMLGRHTLEPHEQRAFQVMEECVRRQQSVIRNLLDLSRLEAGGRPFRHDPIDLAGFLGRVVEDYRHAIDEHGGTVELDIPPLVLRSDEEMLWHVFSNLIHNAIKFRREDVPLGITVTARSEGRVVVVDVADNGIGLDAEVLGRLFTRFFQVSASCEGAGLGLSISRKIVEGLGGRIAASSLGREAGTTITVTLPLG